MRPRHSACAPTSTDAASPLRSKRAATSSAASAASVVDGEKRLFNESGKYYAKGYHAVEPMQYINGEGTQEARRRLDGVAGKSRATAASTDTSGGKVRGDSRVSCASPPVSGFAEGAPSVVMPQIDAAVGPVADAAGKAVAERVVKPIPSADADESTADTHGAASRTKGSAAHGASAGGERNGAAGQPETSDDSNGTPYTRPPTALSAKHVAAAIRLGVQ